MKGGGGVRRERGSKKEIKSETMYIHTTYTNDKNIHLRALITLRLTFDAALILFLEVTKKSLRLPPKKIKTFNSQKNGESDVNRKLQMESHF